VVEGGVSDNLEGDYRICPRKRSPQQHQLLGNRFLPLRMCSGREGESVVQFPPSLKKTTQRNPRFRMEKEKSPRKKRRRGRPVQYSEKEKVLHIIILAQEKGSGNESALEKEVPVVPA